MELRRSTRVPLELSIDVEGKPGHAQGTTVVVNLHGALIRTAHALQAGSHLRVTVYLTGKSENAKVIYVAADDPLRCGIELETPRNIWGVPLPPDDWGEEGR